MAGDYDLLRQMAQSRASEALGKVHSCYCMGPQNGQPLCPCQMVGVIERGGRYIKVEREIDLGPVR